MRLFRRCFALVEVCAFAALALSAAPGVRAGEDYPLGPDSQEQADVPKGTVKDFFWKESTIYPGTERKCSIYLPPNFDANAEYPLMVFQDGGGFVNPKGQFRAPIVFDNLIHKKEIPAMVGLFIDPGSVPPTTPQGKRRSTRSYEYDTANDTYARFLIEEMLPEVAKYAKISAKPEDRAICGNSSGGICAFTVAWFRPDQFRKVVSHIGSFTNIQDGYWYPDAIRKTERKPIRIFLQDGSNDLDNVHGNWPLSAQQMMKALTFAGYDLKWAFGDGGHSGKQGGSLFPDTLRWLWRSEPSEAKPVPEVPQDLALSGLIIPGEEWQVVVDDKKFVDAACADAEGNFYFSDLGGGGGIFKVALDGKISEFNKDATGISGMKFGADGRLYACQNKQKRIIAIDKEGKVEVLATDVGCNDLAITTSGKVYFTETGKKQVVLVEGAGKTRVVDTGITAPNGIALSPDQETLAVSDYAGSAVWSFRVEADGSLSAKLPTMPYRHFSTIPEAKGDGMTCDTRFRFYVSTQTGVQTYDPNGRPIGLILAPTPTPVTSITLAGPGHSYLFLLTQGKIFKRKLNAQGFVTSEPPIYPAKK
jgi:gluconolactonase